MESGSGRITKSLVLRTAVLLFALGFFPSAVYASVKKQLDAGQPILRKDPKTGRAFTSWSLFLVCNPYWAAAEKEADLKDLYASFEHFGDAIGRRNLAVWFVNSKATGKNEHPVLSDTVDLERSSDFCTDWGLTPSHAPYLVVTTTYPDDGPFSGLHKVPALPKDSAIFELGNMKPADIHKLLSGLTDDLIRNGKVTTQHAQPVAVQQTAGLFRRLLETVQRSINDFGCAWSFKVNAGAVQADLKACHTG